MVFNKLSNNYPTLGKLISKRNTRNIANVPNKLPTENFAKVMIGLESINYKKPPMANIMKGDRL